MGKSKSGGTRSFIRGRVGSDVYSIGLDGKGKKQQVVRSIAEQVSNPRTSSQMFGRMLMTTVMQSLSSMKPVIDHAFDGVVAGQPSLSEFIRVNYALLKADAQAHPSTDNVFGLNMYQERGAKPGPYIISAGNAQVPAALAVNAAGVATITTGADSLTVAAVLAALGMTTDEYFTIVGFDSNNEFQYGRVRVSPDANPETVITAGNISTVFMTDASCEFAFAVNGTNIDITTGISVSNAIIISKKTANGYIHNDAQLSEPNDPQYTADVALATYPIGQSRYLNGGDINGEQGGGTPDPVSVASMTVDGVAKTAPADLDYAGASGKTFAGTIANAVSGVTYDIKKSTSSVSLMNPTQFTSVNNGAWSQALPTISSECSYWLVGSDGTQIQLLSIFSGD